MAEKPLLQCSALVVDLCDHVQYFSVCSIEVHLTPVTCDKNGDIFLIIAKQEATKAGVEVLITRLMTDIFTPSCSCVP